MSLAPKAWRVEAMGRATVARSSKPHLSFFVHPAHKSFMKLLYTITNMIQIKLQDGIYPPTHQASSQPPNTSNLNLLPIQIRIKLVPKALRRIIKPKLLIQRVNLLDLFGGKLEVASEVRCETFGRFGFGDDDVAFGDGPC